MAKTTSIDPKTGKPAAEPLKLDSRVENAFMGRPPTERFLATALYAIIMQIDGTGAMLESVLATSQSGEIDWQERIGDHPLIHYNGKTRTKLEEEGHSPQVIKQVKQALARRGIKMDEGQPTPPEPQPGEPIHPAAFSAQQQARDAELTAQNHARALAAAQAAQGAGGAQGADTRSPDAKTPPEPGSQTGGQQPPTQPPTTEPTFAGQPLSAFKGMSRDQILAVDGVNPATADKIVQELAKTP